MLSLVSVECVECQEVRPRQERELPFRDDKMVVLFLPTDRTIASRDTQICRGFRFELHRTAVTAASMLDEFLFIHLQ